MCNTHSVWFRVSLINYLISSRDRERPEPFLYLFWVPFGCCWLHSVTFLSFFPTSVKWLGGSVAEVRWRLFQRRRARVAANVVQHPPMPAQHQQENNNDEVNNDTNNSNNVNHRNNNNKCVHCKLPWCPIQHPPMILSDTTSRPCKPCISKHECRSVWSICSNLLYYKRWIEEVIVGKWSQCTLTVKLLKFLS